MVISAGLFDPPSTAQLSDEELHRFISSVLVEDNAEHQGGIVEDSADMLGNL
jgi:hypothetical protein